MESVATPDADQAEAYVATVALFLIFSQSQKEGKAYLRLPSAWRSLWSELLNTHRDSADAADRDVLRDLRNLIADNFEPTGRELSGTNGKPEESQFLKNGAERVSKQKEDHQPLQLPQDLVQLWSAKVSTDLFKRMLAARRTLPIWGYKDELLQTIERNQAVIVCGETGSDPFLVRFRHIHS